MYAATSDSKITSDSSSTKSSNSVPNPGILQNQPNALSVISKYNSKISNINITSTIGWMQMSNNWYYFNNSSSLATGWISDNRVRYYLYDTGAMAKGWVDSGSDSYYLESSSGKLIKSTTIDVYKIGTDGKKLAAADANANNTNNSTINSNSSTTTSSKFKGIDISHYNGDIDFTKVKADGIQCVYMKATEGTTYIDNYLGTYYKGAKSAGLKTGFYHYLVGTSSQETQAQNFYNNIKDK